MTDTEPGLVALDWGTTGRRAWLLDAAGRILESRRSGRGLLATTEGIDAHDPAARAAAYEEALREACGDWLTAYPRVPVIACGMVGSAQGWVDSGYRTVPAPVGSGTLVRVEHRAGVLHLVPGLRIASDDAAPGDVMRGEETQLVGIIDELGPERYGEALTVVLPGTHSKWVRIEGDGRVTGFATAMSGELYGLLTRHGILARTAESSVRDDAAFARGLAAGRSRGLAAELFAARPLVLDGLLDAGSLPDYVSGVLIADEVAHLLPSTASEAVGTAPEVVLCGAPDLCRRYAEALARHGVRTTVLGEEVTAKGLWRIADRAGLLGPASGRGRQDEDVRLEGTPGR
ncbi:2-dehydro-3-deoxygalactonokinase [Streptomyces antnestii]|uniref:2-dehydro-3-deoxygalactonokinase n=1 Tax=Streptomyces antnestii TaxID=2494256 RepID=A0A3S2XIU7_9ACTN|nr:2-dehydro-3-deoxygalactonokinase [Streptomyces sp. San01]RVU15870.1 2-dehydro-3-deoxygalactonokinase [Streptomyces sp. San01]